MSWKLRVQQWTGRFAWGKRWSWTAERWKVRIFRVFLKKFKKKSKMKVKPKVFRKYGCKVCSFKSKRFNNLKTHVERTYLRLASFANCVVLASKRWGHWRITESLKQMKSFQCSYFFECDVCDKAFLRRTNYKTTWSLT